MQECYLIPYGAIGFVSDILGLYMALCLIFARAPLLPTRKIRHMRVAKYLIFTCNFFVVMLNYHNIGQCYIYWQLLLINIGDAVIAILAGLAFYYAAAAWSAEGEAKARGEDGTEREPVLEGLQGRVPDPERGMGAATETAAGSGVGYGSVGSITSLPGINPQPNVGTAEIGSLNTGTVEVPRDIATELTPKPKKNDDEVAGTICLAIMGVLVGLILTGSIGLAWAAIAQGKESAQSICIAFGILGVLIGLGILCSFLCDCRRAGLEGTIYARQMFGALFCLLILFFSDWILGSALDSVSGVPVADIPWDDLSRYWVYLGAIKLPMLAF
jgi:hypothetical protein